MDRKRATWLVLTFVIVGGLAFIAAVTTPSEARPINCKIVSCAAPDCLDNEHLQVPPGQCCPICVPN
jgi:hypothetical protein